MIDREQLEVINDRKGDWPPVMDYRAFAEWIGVDATVVYAWIRRAYIPATKIGRYQMINVVALIDELREEGR